MNYNIENTLLTDREVEVTKKKADDKLVDILTALVDASSHTFFGEMRLNNFTTNILDVNDQISEIDNLLRTVERKSDAELKELAKEYNIEGFENLNKDLLLYEVQKAIYNKRDELRDQSISISNNYTRNYKNTFEYFINENIQTLEKAIITEHNIDLKDKYKFLLNNFKSLDINLKAIHSWVDAVSPEIYLLNDDIDELNVITNRIKDQQKKFALSTDYNEMLEIKKQIDSDKSKAKDLKIQISVHKSNAIAAFNQNGVQINFADLKLQFFENLVNIKANINDATALNINEEDIDKCMSAFNEYFFDAVSKEFEFRDYLEENDILLENEIVNVSGKDVIDKKIELSRVNDKTNSDQQVEEEKVLPEEQLENSDKVEEQSDEYQNQPTELVQEADFNIEKQQPVVEEEPILIQPETDSSEIVEEVAEPEIINTQSNEVEENNNDDIVEEIEKERPVISKQSQNTSSIKTDDSLHTVYAGDAKPSFKGSKESYIVPKGKTFSVPNINSDKVKSNVSYVGNAKPSFKGIQDVDNSSLDLAQESVENNHTGDISAVNASNQSDYTEFSPVIEVSEQKLPNDIKNELETNKPEHIGFPDNTYDLSQKGAVIEAVRSNPPEHVDAIKHEKITPPEQVVEDVRNNPPQRVKNPHDNLSYKLGAFMGHLNFKLHSIKYDILDSISSKLARSKAKEAAKQRRIANMMIDNNQLYDDEIVDYSENTRKYVEGRGL